MFFLFILTMFSWFIYIMYVWLCQCVLYVVCIFISWMLLKYVFVCIDDTIFTNQCIMYNQPVFPKLPNVMSWPYQVFRELLQMSIEAFCIWNHHEPWHDLGGGAFLTSRRNCVRRRGTGRRHRQRWTQNMGRWHGEARVMYCVKRSEIGDLQG